MIATVVDRIIAPVDRKLLVRELSADKHVRTFRDLEIYAVKAAEAPAVMDEIGRVREIEFRAEGGGTGKTKDIDRYDTDTDFSQLIAWDPIEQEIVAMYRFIRGDGAISDGHADLPTARLFEFSDRFWAEYLPCTIELGRSVVNREAKKKLQGLYAVWSGLGAIVAEMPEMKYLFGKVTSYDALEPEARAVLFYFLNLYFRDPEELVAPMFGLADESDLPSDEQRSMFSGKDYKRDYRALVDFFSSLGETIPPLFISYTGLSATLKVFGTARNPHFGNVLETAILVTIADIHQKHKDRFIGSYESVNSQLFR